MEDPLLKRRDRTPTITVRSDIDEALQPPEVSAEIQKALQPIIAELPGAIASRLAGSIEESAKANTALVKVFPIMLALMLTIIMFQVRSFSAMMHGDADRAPRSRGRRPGPARCSINRSASTPSSG